MFQINSHNQRVINLSLKPIVVLWNITIWMGSAGKCRLSLSKTYTLGWHLPFPSVSLLSILPGDDSPAHPYDETILTGGMPVRNDNTEAMQE